MFLLSLLNFDSQIYSADSLEEIVGLDISYHGGIQQVDTDNESIYPEEERRYFERKEQQRQKQRNKLRRRLLLMDLSISGRNAVTNSGNNGDNGSRRNSSNSNLVTGVSETGPLDDTENPGDGSRRITITMDEVDEGGGARHNHLG